MKANKKNKMIVSVIVMLVILGTSVAALADDGSITTTTSPDTQLVSPSYVGSTESEKQVVLGDVNNDGKANVLDVRITAQATKGLVSLSDTQKKAADLDGDGEISTNDVDLLAELVVSLNG